MAKLLTTSCKFSMMNLRLCFPLAASNFVHNSRKLALLTTHHICNKFWCKCGPWSTPWRSLWGQRQVLSGSILQMCRLLFLKKISHQSCHGNCSRSDGSSPPPPNASKMPTKVVYRQAKKSAPPTGTLTSFANKSRETLSAASFLPPLENTNQQRPGS